MAGFEQAYSLDEGYRVAHHGAALMSPANWQMRPLAVKIDTEGAESFVIEGGPQLLSQSELFFTEVWPYGIAEVKNKQGKVLFQRAGSGPGRVIAPDVDAEMTELMSGVMVGRRSWSPAERVRRSGCEFGRTSRRCPRAGRSRTA